jgi:D-3-phosphoglycerate dehydrogenase
MGAARVVITDTVFPSLEPERAVLAGLAEVELAPSKDEATLREVAAEADALLNCYAPLSADLIRSLRRCRLIARYGIGVDTVDLGAATSAGIMVTNVPDYCIDEVSDHALAVMLALARGLVRAMPATRAGTWDLAVVRPLHRLRGQTLALIGFGRIGRAVAAKAVPLGLRILAHDPYLTPDAIRAGGAEPADLPTVLQEADILSIHAPLTAKTRRLVDAAALEQMKPSAFLVNTARGALVDTHALTAALKAGRLAGAALDVLENEPPPDDLELLRLPNVLVTPHAAFYTEESLVESQTRAAEEVARVLRGERPRSLVNADELASRSG